MDKKRENFERISTARKEKIIQTLDQMSNLSNFSFYEYSNDDVEAIFEEIMAKALMVKADLISKNTRPKGKKRL